LISANDITILTMFSRYPDISEHESEFYMSKIENKENIPICNAILGKISPDDLSVESRKIFDNLKNWSENRTLRIRQNEIFSRKNKKETDFSLKMNELHQKGIISNETLFLYGVSGDLPDIEEYRQMSYEDKKFLWEDRIANRLGVQWRTRFSQGDNLFLFFKEKNKFKINFDWKSEGF
jgi:hypothetical protein